MILMRFIIAGLWVLCGMRWDGMDGTGGGQCVVDAVCG